VKKTRAAAPATTQARTLLVGSFIGHGGGGRLLQLADPRCTTKIASEESNTAARRLFTSSKNLKGKNKGTHET
jgi:hypothetical protein